MVSESRMLKDLLKILTIMSNMRSAVHLQVSMRFQPSSHDKFSIGLSCSNKFYMPIKQMKTSLNHLNLLTKEMWAPNYRSTLENLPQRCTVESLQRSHATKMFWEELYIKPSILAFCSLYRRCYVHDFQDSKVICQWTCKILHTWHLV